MKDKTKVVFLGSRPLGAYALKLLSSMENIEVVACVAKKPPKEAWWDEDPYFSGYPILKSHDSLLDVTFDFGVSINYWRIIPPELINSPKLGFINLHHAYNLSLRGRNMTTYAILNCRESKRLFHGTCLHYIDEGLDTGPIIASKACDITEQDTAWSLFKKTEKLGEELLSEWLPRLCLSRAPVAYPEQGHPLHLRNDDKKDNKFIKDLNEDPLLAYDSVRAYEFGGHFSPAYTLINGAKTYLTISEVLGKEMLLEIDSNRCVYSLRES
tara:strand:+ start:265 stop:1071 length:807 start_codon:yes stop_codon:yes gene_type:complete